MTETILTYISLAIAIISILFVVWDHFKDDRLLTKRVQSFYNNIEGLIYTYYKMRLNLEKFSEDERNKSYEEDFFKYEKENIFYRGRVNQTFEDFSKYLGLTYFIKAYLYCVQNYEYLIENIGAFHKLICKLPQVSIGNEISFYDNQLKKIVINKESINIMNKFLETLRNHWNKYYYKPIFRKKLKSRLDFSQLLNHS